MTVDNGQWTEAQATDAYRREQLRLLKVQADAAQSTRTAVMAILAIAVVMLVLQFVVLGSV